TRFAGFHLSTRISAIGAEGLYQPIPILVRDLGSGHVKILRSRSHFTGRLKRAECRLAEIQIHGALLQSASARDDWNLSQFIIAKIWQQLRYLFDLSRRAGVRIF